MKTRRETPTLLSVGGRLTETLGLSQVLSHGSRRTCTDQASLRRVPKEGSCLLSGIIISSAPRALFKKIIGDVGKETKMIKEKKNKLFHLEYSLQVRDTESRVHGLWSPHLLSDASVSLGVYLLRCRPLFLHAPTPHR